jgi:hypothetical protein
MEPLGFAALVPGAVEFDLQTGGVFVAGLLVALLLLVLVVRGALDRRMKKSEKPQSRVLDGGKEPGRRAA